MSCSGTHAALRRRMQPKGSDHMLAWLSANLINIALVVFIALIVALLIRGMIRDRKAGKSSCGGNCAACGACGSCGKCGAGNAAAMSPRKGVQGE